MKVWSAEVTADMVAHLSNDEISELVKSLSDAVANICQESGVE